TKLGAVNAQPTALARLRAIVLSPAQIFPFVVAQLAALWLIIGTGAAVRLTDSGLGCRHWPGCEEGHPLPAKNAHAFVEFGNRLVGAITIALTLLVWLAVRRTSGLPRWAPRLALGIFLGTLAQAPIGLLAIASDLRWPIVMLHLLLSIALLAAATVLALEVRSAVVGRTEPLVPLELRRLGFAFVVAGFVLLLVQMGLGELQWRTHLPWGLVLLHVFLAATVWIGTVALATLFFRPNVDFAHR